MKPLPTIILNLIVGLPCAYMFVWLFPVVYQIQQFTMYLSQPENTSLVLQGALGVLFILLYGIIAFYTLFTAGYETMNLYREYIKEREGYL